MRIAWRTVRFDRSPVWATPPRGSTRWLACNGSGSMRIPTSAAQVPDVVGPTTTSGRLVWGHPVRERRDRARRFDAPEASGQVDAPRYHVNAVTGPNGSPTWSQSDAQRHPMRRRFTSSVGPLGTRIPCVARRGTPPAAGVTSASRGGPMADTPQYPPEPALSSTRTIFAVEEPENLTDSQRVKAALASPRPTRGLYAPTYSEACARSSNFPATKPGAALAHGGSPGHGAAASIVSSRCNVRIVGHRAQIPLSHRPWPYPTSHRSRSPPDPTITRMAFASPPGPCRPGMPPPGRAPPNPPGQ